MTLPPNGTPVILALVLAMGSCENVNAQVTPGGGKCGMPRVVSAGKVRCADSQSGARDATRHDSRERPTFENTEGASLCRPPFA
jgi:hypothetical protein